MSSINTTPLPFRPNHYLQSSNRLRDIHSCISIHRYGRLRALVESKPWIAAIHRLLRAEPRRDPRQKPNKPVQDKVWNQADLAVAAKIEGTTLSSILLGRRIPSTDTLCKIAKALGVNPAVLWLTTEEAAALEHFHQHRATVTQTATLEDTVTRLLERRAEEQKQAFIAREREAVLDELQRDHHALPEVAAPRRAGKTK